MKWFDIDKAGLASIIERRGKAFTIFELASNGYDAGATTVVINLRPIPNSPTAALCVTDNSTEGWENLADAFTVFGRSRRAGDSEKRGRFGFGEKLVLAISSEAMIETMQGSIYFEDNGNRRQSSEKRAAGTCFSAVIRCTRDELAEIEESARRMIPPVYTSFNDIEIKTPKLLKKFTAKLPTEIRDADGLIRRTVRQCAVEVYESDGQGDILEMGIPICSAEWPWRLNVMQKVPVGMERESVTDAFRKALQVAAVNAMAETLNEEQAAQPWATEAIGDSRIAPDALSTVVKQRFGERAVVAVPGDPVANATAEAKGFQVIHGGALPAEAWANIRKHSLIPSTSQTFPTPKAADLAAAKEAAGDACPLCGTPLRS